ncbi:MAG: acyl carrier protein [Ruminococcus sp.]|nr:acyl carrier protein [Ruminococcus sp.]
MDKQNVLPRLTQVFRDVFGDDSIVISDSTTSADIEDWDSIEHINLIGAVEDEFSMSFKMREVSGMKNVGEMIALICERGK